MDELNAIGGAETRGVVAGHLQAPRRDVGGEVPRPRVFQRERDRQTAAARADVDDRERAAETQSRQEQQRFFDQQLGFGTRDQDGRRDTKLAAVELLCAADVRDGLARRRRSTRAAYSGSNDGGRFFALTRHPGRAVPRQRVTREQLGVERRFGGRNTRRLESLARLGHELAERHGAPVTSPSSGSAFGFSGFA